MSGGHKGRSPAFYARISEAQNHRCCYCGVRFGASIPELGWTPFQTALTLEHVRPKSEGGGHGWDNIAGACRRCNHRRGCEDALAFFERKGWFSSKQRRKADIWARLIREREPLSLEAQKRLRRQRSASFQAQAQRREQRRAQDARFRAMAAVAAAKRRA